MSRHDHRRRSRLIAGLIAAATGATGVIASFLAWITTPMSGGGRTTVSGWGVIGGGDPEVDGANLNSIVHALTDGAQSVGSYRPGLAALVIGLVTIVPGVVLAATRRRRRPSRPAGVALAVCGAAGSGWGLAKSMWPGDLLGVLPDDEVGLGAGPVVAAVAGVLALGIAVAWLAGLFDDPDPLPRRGIGPR